MKTLSFIIVAFLLTLGLVQADFTKFIELSEELGSGKCSKSRFGEVMQEIITCQDKGQKERTIANICSNNENSLKCIDDHMTECWTPEGIKKYKAATLQYILKVLSSEQTEEFKSCLTYIEIIGSGKTNEILLGNSIYGANPWRKSSLNELQEFNEEIGNGKCSIKRSEELLQQQKICSQEALSQLKPTRNILIACPIIDDILKCMDAYSECYSQQELINLKDITMQVTLEFLKNIADESGSSHLVSSIGLLRNCPTVKAVPFGFFGAS